MLLSEKLHNTELFRIQVFFDHASFYSFIKKTSKASLSPTSLTNASLTGTTDTTGFYEINLYFRDGTAVIIDAQSLWLSLQLSIKNIGPYSYYDDLEKDIFFSFKKISFNLSFIKDAVGCGTYDVLPSQLSTSNNKITSSNIISQSVTSRFFVAHPQSMLELFVATGSINSSFSAVRFANKVASKVGGAVFNIAKSYLWSSNSQNASLETNHLIQRSPSPSIPGKTTTINSVLTIKDGGRHILRMLASPPQYHLVALSDTLGRVLVLDTNTCDIVSIWKGFREAQCDWVECDSSTQALPNPNEKNHRHYQNMAQARMLCLVLYASRLGLLQVYSMFEPTKPLATFSIGRGYQLISSVPHSLGESLLAELGASSQSLLFLQRKSCFILHPDGHISQLVIKLNAV